MSTIMSVNLTRDPAAPHWGKNALLSSDGQQMNIHLTGSDTEHLVVVQKAARRLQSQGINDVALNGEGWELELQWAFAQGFIAPKGHQSVLWADSDGDVITELDARLSAGVWLRKVINESPENMYPVALASSAAEFIEQLAPAAVSYKLIIGDELLDEGWVGVHTVGRASVHPPVMLELDYNPSGDPEAPVEAALVGKGITFDSGGYSIKPSAGMVSMKCDMGGAATVTAGLGLAISRGLNKRTKLILCCAENLINGEAYKLGDIITYKNGTTVEILNTDAEGRLVLADGLQVASDSKAPLIIDAATLTGAAVIAMGTEYNALFALDKGLAQRVQAYGEQENEANWPLPLAKWHQDQCPSPYADTANTAMNRAGGASNAAGFLSRFVGNEGQGWIHMDLAACFQDSANAMWAAGATGAGIRTIARTLCEEAK